MARATRAMVVMVMLMVRMMMGVDLCGDNFSVLFNTPLSLADLERSLMECEGDTGMAPPRALSKQSISSSLRTNPTDPLSSVGPRLRPAGSAVAGAGFRLCSGPPGRS